MVQARVIFGSWRQISTLKNLHRWVEWWVSSFEIKINLIQSWKTSNLASSTKPNNVYNELRWRSTHFIDKSNQIWQRSTRFDEISIGSGEDFSHYSTYLYYYQFCLNPTTWLDQVKVWLEHKYNLDRLMGTPSASFFFIAMPTLHRENSLEFSLNLYIS